MRVYGPTCICPLHKPCVCGFEQRKDCPKTAQRLNRTRYIKLIEMYKTRFKEKWNAFK